MWGKPFLDYRAVNDKVISHRERTMLDSGILTTFGDHKLWSILQENELVQREFSPHQIAPKIRVSELFVRITNAISWAREEEIYERRRKIKVFWG